MRKKGKGKMVCKEWRGLSSVAIAAAGLLLVASSSVAAGQELGADAERVMSKLRAVADSPRYYWSWTHAWVEKIWDKDGDARFAVETDGKFAPIPTAEVSLESRYQKYADGRRCVISYSDLAAVAGTWYSPRHYAANRASLSAAIKRQWRELGGVMVFTWHMDHPYCTNGIPGGWSFRFKSGGKNRNVVGQILDGTGEECGTGCIDGRSYGRSFANPRAWFLAALDDVADFFNGLVDDDTGARIPVIVRYPHEMDGAWFWWGHGWCSTDEFRRLCRMEADYLRRKCPGQIIFAYTPDRTWTEFGKEGDVGNTFLAYYPGDKYVDIIGIDDYSIGKGDDGKAESSLSETVRKLRLMSVFAGERGQVVAITETGGPKKRDDFWEYLHRAMTADGVKCAFVDTWCGCNGTIPDTPASERDEIAFSRRKEVLMEGSGSGFRKTSSVGVVKGYRK